MLSAKAAPAAAVRAVPAIATPLPDTASAGVLWPASAAIHPRLAANTRAPQRPLPAENQFRVHRIGRLWPRVDHCLEFVGLRLDYRRRAGWRPRFRVLAVRRSVRPRISMVSLAGAARLPPSQCHLICRGSSALMQPASPAVARFLWRFPICPRSIPPNPACAI